MIILIINIIQNNKLNNIQQMNIQFSVFDKSYNLQINMIQKEEEIEPRTITTQPAKGSQVIKVEQQSKLIKKSQDPLLNPMVDPSKVKDGSEQAFQAAHGQRKAMNIERIRQYMQKRIQSVQERVRICDTIRSMFFEKQKNTKAFLKNIIRFFEDYADLYTGLYKSINKLQLKKKYQNHPMYAAVKQAVAQLVTLNDDEADHVQKFVDWLQKILVQALKSADSYFKDRMKKLNKDLQTVDYNYFHSWEKQQKAYEKLCEGNDLLQKQLILMEHIKNSNETSITRAVQLNQAWENLIEEENTIKKLLKDNILQFYERFVKFHKRTDAATSIYKYWSTLPQSANALTIYASFLDQKSVQYILFGTKYKRLNDNFQNFMRMAYEEQRVGNPYIYLDILVAKKYASKIQISQRDWKQIKLIFTVDHNLLIVDQKQGKVVLKLMQNSLKLKRVSQNILQMAGLQEGVIFNSKKKECIHFETIDGVEEFIYYVNAIPNKKEEQK